VKDYSKVIESLKSPKVSIIKKRQIMRNIYGDYRLKMTKEETKTNSNQSSVTFIPLKSTSKIESKFIHEKSSTNVENKEKKQPFKFNFDIATESIITK
jgi:hypothetical protein